MSEPVSPGPAARLARRIPIDAIALVVVALLVSVIERHFIKRGMCFNDPSWYFHFGHRTLAGDVPYRDYVFQVGPLPIYVDAGFQELFGGRYMSSLYAALAIKVLRVWVAWMLVRRLADVRVAAVATVFCLLDPTVSYAYHWSIPYAQLFIALGGLFFVLAVRSEDRKQLTYLVLAGFSAGMTVWARQSTAVMIAIVGLVATGLMLYRKEYFTRRRFVAVWSGFAAAFVLLALVMALQGALGPTIQQMFLDAPSKKAVGGLDAVLDALSGGALLHARFDPTFTWWSSFLYFIGVPIACVTLACYLASRKQPISGPTLAVLVLPVLLVHSLIARDASFGEVNDLPRSMFTVLVALAVLFPQRLRDWFGLEPIVAFALAGLPLCSDWALEISNPGRGWGDPQALVLGIVIVAIASTRIGLGGKLGIASVLAFCSVVHITALLRGHYNPFGVDGPLDETKLRVTDPLLYDIRFGEARMRAYKWLRTEVTPGSTCFIYGNMPVLYTLLECRNPTRIDSTAADFLTADDANEAIDALRRSPPAFIITNERAWLNPPLTLDLGGDVANYPALNPKASMALHVGLRSLIGDYESVGLASEVLGPEFAKQLTWRWDALDQVRIYRRKR